MNQVTRRFLLQSLSLLLLIVAAVPPGQAAPVLLISIDGLKPEYVTEADSRGLKVPYLRTLMRDGAYAEGVTGVWPTVTYPSHTTLLTGVSPAEHGILNNHEFHSNNVFRVGVSVGYTFGERKPAPPSKPTTPPSPPTTPPGQ